MLVQCSNGSERCNGISQIHTLRLAYDDIYRWNGQLSVKF